MKLRKIIVRSCTGLALAFALATGAGYCWLNSWRWGSAPEAHESFSAGEVALLQAFDAYVAASAHSDIPLPEVDAAAPLAERIRWQVLAALEKRAWGSMARLNLHEFMESPQLRAFRIELIQSACHKPDFALIKLLVQKGADPVQTLPSELASFSILELLLTYPVDVPSAERRRLLDWLYERGIDVNTVDPEYLCSSAEAAIEKHGADGAALLDWALRHGYTRAKLEEVTMLLLSSPDSINSLQQLMNDGVLPPPDRSWLNVRWAYTLVSGYISNPEALRWVLSHGVELNRVQGDMEEPVLHACMRHLSYMQRGLGEDTEAFINSRIEELELLLAHGAVANAETKNLLPVDEALRTEIVDMFRKHGIQILAGDNPCNACCSPDA